MNANALSGLTPRKRHRGRAVAALLPGVFALLFAGVSGVAASSTPAATPTATPAPTPTPKVCHHGTNPDGTCCPRWNPCVTPPPTLTPTPTATPTPTPKPTPTPTGSTNGGNGSPTPTPKPTATPAPKPSGSSGSTGSGHSGGSSGATGATGASGVTKATRVQVPADPTPFGALGTVAALSPGGLDAARIPPVEALTPLSGLDFGTGLNLGPLLLLIDLIGIGLLVYLVRTRWLAPEA
jgi:hypothetical protein